MSRTVLVCGLACGLFIIVARALRLGYQEQLIILVIAMVSFGLYKLPELAKSLGKSVKAFKRTSSAGEGSDEHGVSRKVLIQSKGGFGANRFVGFVIILLMIIFVVVMIFLGSRSLSIGMRQWGHEFSVEAPPPSLGVWVG